jgi:hypothetical protein
MNSLFTPSSTIFLVSFDINAPCNIPTMSCISSNISSKQLVYRYRLAFITYFLTLKYIPSLSNSLVASKVAINFDSNEFLL